MVGAPEISHFRPNPQLQHEAFNKSLVIARFGDVENLHFARIVGAIDP